MDKGRFQCIPRLSSPCAFNLQLPQIPRVKMKIESLPIPKESLYSYSDIYQIYYIKSNTPSCIYWRRRHY